MNLASRLKAAQPILIALLIAIFLRAWAVSLLPQDFDEPVYLQNGFDYAHLIQTGNWNGVIDYAQTAEHPDLVKLMDAGGVLILGRAASWTNAFYLARAFSALFGVLAVALLAIAVDPLAAGMLAVHTLAVKYTSQVYLEAVPAAMSLASVLCFLRIKKGETGRWFWLSALALGMATAGKYTYTPVTVIVLAYLSLFEKKLPWYWALVYSIAAMGTFLLLDIHLWHDPINRLIQSLSFHVQYSQGAHVQEIGYPWYQPFIWIFTSAPVGWHLNVFFYFGFDGLILILAVAGLPREWKHRRWLVVWFAAGLLFLLLWPTKWPQYALILTPALCMMGAGSLRQLWAWLRKQESYWEYFRNVIPSAGRWFWWTVGAFVFFIAVIYLSAAVKLAVGKIGWSHMTAQNTFLPENKINALLPLPDGQMVIATDKGAAVYSPPERTDGSGTWVVFTAENSELSDDRVLSLALDPGGDLWFGTATGLDRYDGKTWTAVPPGETGLLNGGVNSLAVDDRGGVIAGTQTGAWVWQKDQWTSLDPAGGSKPVFSVASTGEEAWLGTQAGAWQVSLTDGTSHLYPTTSAVKHILLSTDGIVWAATSGSGLARLEAGTWQYYTSANSGLPLNLVNWVEEVQPGVLWAATSFAGNVGGEVAAFDHGKWAVFSTENSGASDSEPRVIAHSSDGQAWIGTASRGIDLYKLGR